MNRGSNEYNRKIEYKWIKSLPSSILIIRSDASIKGRIEWIAKNKRK